MRFLSVQQMRAADAATMARPETAGMFLMFRAGRAVARAAARLSRLRGGRRIVCVAGRGNNGGDAIVAARLLSETGFSVHLLLAADPAQLRGDAATAWRWFSEAALPVTCCPDPAAWREPSLAAGTLLMEGVVVDGVLGTGCSRAPEGTVLEAIRWINARRPAAAVLAVDLPSGMNGDTGACPGEAVAADWTVTLARPKPCFARDGSVPWVGHLSVADIGMPDTVADAESTPTGFRLIAGPEVLRALPTREAASHKGDYGRLLIIGGSDAYPHAPVLAAAGALRAGVGLLTLAASEASRPAAAALAPEAMFTALPQTGGTLSAEALAAAGIALERFDGIVLGPGLGRTPATAQLVEWILRRAPGRLLLDADALTLLAEIGSLSDGAPATQQRILTPHPGEAARLAGLSAGAVQAARSGSVRALADRYRATVVLKGSGTLVCDPGEEPWLNRTGNPGMATGGSGDVLAGIIGALWVQGLTSLQATTLGVWLHGCAGDRAAWRLNTPSVTARDLLAHLRFDPEQ